MLNCSQYFGVASSYPTILANVVFVIDVVVVVLCRFCKAVENACVDAVDSGHMTKDLAACIYGLSK